MFSNRLKMLRTEKHLTQKQLAINTYIGESTIQSYELGTRLPTLPALVTLSRYFNVSIDYLVGESDNPKRR